MDSDGKQVTFFRFEDLRVYHKALDYATWVHDACVNLPTGYDQLRNSFQLTSSNIAVQIAEGSARNKNQFIYYLKMAKSSVRECLVYTSIAAQLKLISNKQEDESRNELMELTKMVGALIGSLLRSSGGYDGEDADLDHQHEERSKFQH